MRRVAMAALVLLAGCQKSFDDRYAEAQKKLREQAASIDRELAERASEAAMASPIPAPASSPAAPPRRIPRP
ncbi:MAG: hypothetical protein JF595_00600 [Sphingomonadales bacterium]|nr:hypothetical protein [Sphingomonadales bacterium]